MTTFADVVLSRAADDHVGLRFGDQSWTWAQVVQEAADRTALLDDLGLDDLGPADLGPAELGPGGRQPHVGVLLENTPEFVFWTCAAALSGAVLVGINPTRRGAELGADIRHTDCDLIVTEDRLAGLLDGVDCGVPAERVLSTDSDRYKKLVDQHHGAGVPVKPVGPDAMLLLLFSSGSTGAPKAVICSQGRLGQIAASMHARTQMTRDSVTYLCMPLFHGNSMMMNLAPAMYVGATVGLARKFSASGFARDIRRYQATYVNYVGRALSYVLSVPPGPEDAASTLQFAYGTEASPADVGAFQDRFGCQVVEGYGMSEGVLRINRTPDTPPDSLGVPVAGADIRVMDEATGAECPPARFDARGRLLNAEEAIGQIVAVGMAGAFEGYYRNPQAQADRVRGADFWTGDLAYRDAAGYFYFAGRSSDWLRVDSENFAAAPVERILQRWERVSAALVYAVPDARTGDQVMCALQLAEGAPFDPAAFAAFLDAQPDLGTKWRPRFVRVVAEVPVTGSNKVAKTGLRREAWLTSDPVYWRPGSQVSYRLMDTSDREALEAEFARHGRTALHPSPVPAS